jgi:signal transduction histidine kinase
MNAGRGQAAELAPANGSINEVWIQQWRCRAMRVVALALSVAMCAIVVRGALLGHRLPWCDLVSVFLLTGVGWLSLRRPAWLNPLAWVVLGCLFLDVADGIFPWHPRPITATHVLLPPLVLYGAILGNARISAVTAAGIFGIYGATWQHYHPLAPPDFEILTNLILVTVCFCLLAAGLRFQHRRFVGAIQRQAADLRAQLEENQRLNAVISHDINNPLSALLVTVESAQASGRITPEELATVGRMAERIAAIVRSVRQINADTGGQLALAEVEVRVLADELREIFALRLAAKEQQLVLAEGGELRVATDARILCCSVLGNLLSNAIKFSPRGAQITLCARREEPYVRLELHNPGAGIAPEVLQQVQEGRSPGSRPGTEAETGAGYGLRIARFYLLRMGGRFAADNEAGGAVVSLLLPPTAEQAPAAYSASTVSSR